MFWLAFAALGVLLCLAGAAMLVMLRSRRRLRRTPGVFRCRMRDAGPLCESRWSRTTDYACWVHDVLLVRQGPTLTRCEALAVSNVTGPLFLPAVKGLGERPVWLRLYLDDGRLIDLAARNGDVTPAIGPPMGGTSSTSNEHRHRGARGALADANAPAGSARTTQLTDQRGS